ncbi:MAG: DNA alkylation repair protein, partial [Clostridia bacterium]|nr:DNA alkylation repair protein [Clostridia bacterium]
MAERLCALADPSFASFQRKLIPTVDPESVLGVRTPALRALAKELEGSEEAEAFLEKLPHALFEENQLHAFLLSREKEYAPCRDRVEVFLPYVDNWATCDQMNPAAFRKHPELIKNDALCWIGSERTYTVRFGVLLLMRHGLDGLYSPSIPEAVAGIRTDEYYVKMMIAWFFATALAKRYEEILPYIREKRLAPWILRKAVQKAL